MRVIDIKCDYDWNRESQCKCSEYQKEDEGKLCEFTLARGFKYFCELKMEGER